MKYNTSGTMYVPKRWRQFCLSDRSKGFKLDSDVFTDEAGIKLLQFVAFDKGESVVNGYNKQIKLTNYNFCLIKKFITK